MVKQCDVRWGSVKLLPSKRTICQVGCVTCCCSMFLSFLGRYVAPDVLSRRLKYTVEAFLIWSSLKEVGLELENRFKGHKLELIKEALKHPKKSAWLNVDRGAHWVLGITYLGFNRYWVADSLTGKRKVYSGVVGGAIVKDIKK